MAPGSADPCRHACGLCRARDPKPGELGRRASDHIPSHTRTRPGQFRHALRGHAWRTNRRPARMTGCTRAAGESLRTAPSSRSRVLLSFGFEHRAKASEVPLPHRTQQRLDRRAPIPVRAIETTRPLPSLDDESGVLQDPQVQGNCLPRDVVEVVRDVPRGKLPLPDQFQDPPTARARCGS